MRDGKISNWCACETGTVRIEMSCAAPVEAPATSSVETHSATLYMNTSAAVDPVDVYLGSGRGVTGRGPPDRLCGARAADYTSGCDPAGSVEVFMV